MQKTHRPLIGCLVILTSLIPAASARAGYVTETISTGSQGTSTDFSMNLALPAFNTDLGKLTGVTLSYDVSESMSGTITNHADRPEDYQVTDTSNFTLSLYGQQLLTNTLSSQQGYSGLGSQATATFGTFESQATTAPKTYTESSILQAFESPSGTMDLNFSSLTSTLVVGGGGNASTGIYTTAIGSVTVTFLYSPAVSSVPEPSSLLMLSAGLTLVGLSKLRRRKKPSKPETTKLSHRSAL